MVNTQIKEKLSVKFREQSAFSTGYAPLYERLFGTVANWLADDKADSDELVQWLVNAGNHRKALDVTLLLTSGLHRAILAGKLPHLASYYPSVGGTKSFESTEFADDLRAGILAQRTEIADLMVADSIQTNETGRGLCWLLPLQLTGWDKVHLVDLGASAGLNLLADQRHYQITSAEEQENGISLGAGTPPQFSVRYEGETLLTKINENLRPLPQILSRTGGDLHPFRLASAEDELRLCSFVWPEHTARLKRLQEGIAVFRHFADEIQLHPLELPAGVEQFLAEKVPADNHPVLIYNTVMTFYLPDKGASLPERIGRWAQTQNRPVLWLQWEPFLKPVVTNHRWMAWKADYWHKGTWFSEQLGRIHPHGHHYQADLLFAKGELFDTIWGDKT